VLSSKNPLIFLQNTSGFTIGLKSENEGIARSTAQMAAAVATANVPKFTIIINGSFGAGNYCMCGRSFSPRFLWLWPTARVSMMSSVESVAVLTDNERDSAKINKEP
jgi:3-methylcrotonyl-CoA carboxylase beta subunit